MFQKNKISRAVFTVLITLLVVGCGGYSPRAYRSDIISNIDSYSESDQIRAISSSRVRGGDGKFYPAHNGYMIRYINRPSEKVQLAAVRSGLQGWKNIQYIKNPSEKVQLAAVKQNGHALQYINSSSEKVQLAAVKQNGNAIQYIKNPSEKVQIAAVTANIQDDDTLSRFNKFNAIKYIKIQ